MVVIGGLRFSAVLFAHDDAFPLVEQPVAPEQGVDAVLGQGEHQVHQ
jgi:hypothetical protein